MADAATAETAETVACGSGGGTTQAAVVSSGGQWWAAVWASHAHPVPDAA